MPSGIRALAFSRETERMAVARMDGSVEVFHCSDRFFQEKVRSVIFIKVMLIRQLCLSIGDQSYIDVFDQQTVLLKMLIMFLMSTDHPWQRAVWDWRSVLGWGASVQCRTKRWNNRVWPDKPESEIHHRCIRRANLDYYRQSTRNTLSGMFSMCTVTKISHSSCMNVIALGT